MSLKRNLSNRFFQIICSPSEQHDISSLSYMNNLICCDFNSHFFLLHSVSINTETLGSLVFFPLFMHKLTITIGCQILWMSVVTSSAYPYLKKKQTKTKKHKKPQSSCLRYISSDWKSSIANVQSKKGQRILNDYRY